MDLINVVLSAGRASVDVVLYTLIPVMVVMLVFMRFLEEWGFFRLVVRYMTPILTPFGLTGMSVFALLQMNFISFAAPMATLALMANRGTSERNLAAALAMTMAMGQGNVFYPMTALGLDYWQTVIISIIGGLVASSSVYYVFGRKLSKENHSLDKDDSAQEEAAKRKNILSIINEAGTDAIRMSAGALPMLLISLSIVYFLKEVGAIDLISSSISPFMAFFNIHDFYILPTITKYLAGGTAYMGVMTDLISNKIASPDDLNRTAGFFINTLDLGGLAIYLGLSSRIYRLTFYIIAGTITGIVFRTFAHLILN